MPLAVPDQTAEDPKPGGSPELLQAPPRPPRPSETETHRLPQLSCHGPPERAQRTAPHHRPEGRRGVLRPQRARRRLRKLVSRTLRVSRLRPPPATRPNSCAAGRDVSLYAISKSWRAPSTGAGGITAAEATGAARAPGASLCAATLRADPRSETFHAGGNPTRDRRVPDSPGRHGGLPG